MDGRYEQALYILSKQYMGLLWSKKAEDHISKSLSPEFVSPVFSENLLVQVWCQITQRNHTYVGQTSFYLLTRLYKDIKETLLHGQSISHSTKSVCEVKHLSSQICKSADVNIYI